MPGSWCTQPVVGAVQLPDTAGGVQGPTHPATYRSPTVRHQLAPVQPAIPDRGIHAGMHQLRSDMAIRGSVVHWSIIDKP